MGPRGPQSLAPDPSSYKTPLPDPAGAALQACPVQDRGEFGELSCLRTVRKSGVVIGCVALQIDFSAWSLCL